MIKEEKETHYQLKEREKAAIQRQRLLRLAVRTAAIAAVFVFVWIAADGYHRLVSQQVVQKSAYLIKPLSPAINTEALDEIEEKEVYSLSEVDAIFKKTAAIEEGLSKEEASPSGEEAGSNEEEGDEE